MVAAATLVLTVFLYIIVPKGFFPVQDTGMIQGISEAPQTISFRPWPNGSRQLAHVILKDPAVESLSSFIGVDGTNTTLNSGRILINLKPLEERKISASDVIRRLQPQLAKVEGITLYMQPVQDLTVEDRVSRTQYQYTLEDPESDELNTWTARFVAEAEGIAGTARRGHRPADLGLAASLVIDRETASRLGITPQMIDETLYDAFGQRQISTLYTQLNQYHVVLETMPEFQKNPGEVAGYLRALGAARRRLIDELPAHRRVSVNGDASCIDFQRLAAVDFGSVGHRDGQVGDSDRGDPANGGSGAAQRVHAFRDQRPRRSRSTIRGNSRW